MTIDSQLLVAGTTAAPAAYTVPNTVEVTLLCVNAVVDGSAAAAPFYATVEIISDGGVVVARCPCFTTIAAGGTAEISWFRMRNGISSSSTQSTYEQTILSTPGIRVYWKLDETSGTTALDSGPVGVNLDYANFPALGQPPLADGHSVTFTAASSQRAGSFVAAPGIVGIQANGQMTVEGWLKTTSAVFSFVVSSYSASADGDFFYVRMEAAGTLTYAIFGTDAVGHGLFGAVPVNDGSKHYFACTFDATTMKLYVDGVLDAQVNPAMGGFPLSDHNHGVVLGADFSGFPVYTNFFNGTLDEVSIYDTALTAAQVLAHYNAGA